MNALILAAALLVQDAGGAASEPDDLVGASQGQAAAEAVSETAIALLDDLPASIEGWSPEGMDGAIAMQVFAMAGREDLIIRHDEGAFRYRECPVLEADGLARVIDEAREAQIVIINEAHDQPLHRRTIEEIALALSDQFDVFGAETFNYLNLMGERPPGALGWYDREPIFARQVAALEAAGYDFVAYEIRADQRDPEAQSRADRIALREEAQANNLIAEVLADDPDARIIIHVGYSHALEAPQPQGEDDAPLVWFAARLKEKTGIDPLTISQTHCSLAAPQLGEGRAEDEEGGADPELAASPLRPVIADGSDAAPEGAIDLFLARGDISFTDQRPAWRRAMGDIPVAVPDALAPQDAALIIEARAPGQSLDHMPVDRLLVYPGETPVLLLPEGDWILTAWTAEGAYGEPVEVSAP